MMCGGGDGRARGKKERGSGGRRGEEGDCLWACWVAECRQLEEELMGMVSARSGVTGESFSTLPLPAPQLSSLWNSAPPAPTQACVCFKPCFFPFQYFFSCFFLPHSVYLSPLTKKTKKLEQPYFGGDGTVELLFCVCVCVCGRGGGGGGGGIYCM